MGGPSGWLPGEAPGSGGGSRTPEPAENDVGHTVTGRWRPRVPGVRKTPDPNRQRLPVRTENVLPDSAAPTLKRLPRRRLRADGDALISAFETLLHIRTSQASRSCLKIYVPTVRTSGGSTASESVEPKFSRPSPRSREDSFGRLEERPLVDGAYGPNETSGRNFLG